MGCKIKIISVHLYIHCFHIVGFVAIKYAFVRLIMRCVSLNLSLGDEMLRHFSDFINNHPPYNFLISSEKIQLGLISYFHVGNRW